MKKLVPYLFLILLFASCEEQTLWELQNKENDFIVVDGIVTSELKQQTLTIAQPISAINNKPQPLSGMTVLVSSNQLVYEYREMPDQPGTYVSTTEFQGVKGRTYSLLITKENKAYSAKAVLAAPVTSFTFIEYQKNAGERKYHFTKVPFPYNPTQPAMFEIQLNWSTAPGYENENPELCKAKLYYYSLPTLDVSELFAPNFEKIEFPSGTIITERRYSLTNEHASYIRAMLLETTWQGGFFNTASANVPTNLSEGAIGFFGACGVTEQIEIAK